MEYNNGVSEATKGREPVPTLTERCYNWLKGRKTEIRVFSSMTIFGTITFLSLNKIFK